VAAIHGRMRVTRLDPDGPGEINTNSLAHGVRRRYFDNTKYEVTHPLTEMLQEAARLHALQLEKLVEAGCVECGDPVAVIAYPPDWAAQMVWNGRYPGEGSKRAIEISTQVRMLCEQHAREGSLW
jgi:hypothetical protein